MHKAYYNDDGLIRIWIDPEANADQIVLDLAEKDNGQVKSMYKNITEILKVLFFIPKNSLIYPEYVRVDKRSRRGYSNY